eukprot:6192031-Pleurochrysis_carterae.AAC.8
MCIRDRPITAASARAAAARAFHDESVDGDGLGLSDAVRAVLRLEVRLQPRRTHTRASRVRAHADEGARIHSDAPVWTEREHGGEEGNAHGH